MKRTMDNKCLHILIIDDGEDFIKQINSQYIESERLYSFSQITLKEFYHYQLPFDVLLISINSQNINDIISQSAKIRMVNEVPSVIVVDETIPDTALVKINFKNTLVLKQPFSIDEFKYNLPIVLKKIEIEEKLNVTENKVDTLQNEIEQLKGEIDLQYININELSQTNFHLVNATWRERDVKKKLTEELDKLSKENEFNKININELTSTNEHLIAATWRERDLKKQLKEAMDEVTKSKQLIEAQNKKISESINYSRRIQNVILPDEELIKKDLKQSFILYIPKDVVSGDFPFYYKDNHAIYLAAIDCTGHGVPGAMLSLIGNLILNDILNDPWKKVPSEILEKLHSKIVKTLKQDIKGNDTSDGMDIALCVIDYKENVVRYSGAHRPMYHIRNNELVEYKGTRLPIGGTQYKKEIKYIDHEIEIMPDDLFFIFSDGFPDQFGGSLNEKYGPIRIQNYLLANRHLSMDELKEGLRMEFLEWKGEYKQTDDILFIGFKF